MAGSLLDFGEMARTMIGLENLIETRRRNEIFEQNSLIEQQRLQATQQNLRLSAATKAYDEIEKVKQHPALATNREQQVNLLLVQGKLLQEGFGVDVPMPSKEELLGGYEAQDQLIRAIRSGDREKAMEAMQHAAVSNPTWFKSIADDMKRAGELSGQMEDLALKVELNKAKLSELNLKAGRVKLQQGLYTEHLGALGETLRLVERPEYKEHFYKLLSLDKPEAKQAYLNMHPEFRQSFEKDLLARTSALGATIVQLSTDIMARKEVLDREQTQHGAAPQGLADEIAGYNVVRTARELELAWADDPFNREKWKALKKAEQSVKILYGSTNTRLQGIEEERLGFLKAKAEDVKQAKLAADYAQEQFLTFLQKGYDDNTAGLLAIQATKQAYPGVPFETKELKNLNKVGRQTVDIKFGQEDVTRNLKLIENSQSVIDFAKELSEKIRQNPAIVGKGAQIGTALAGAGQQLRAILRMDPGAASVLNTKTRDEAEALHEVLVYMQARAMDPTGPLDLKVVEHARQTIGPLSELTTGPGQLLNKLDLAVSKAEANIRRARRRLREGIPAYLTDESQSAAQKPVSAMSESELIQTIMQGIKGATE